MKLRFTPRATQDLHDIAAYIRLENPRAALRVRDAIFETLNLLRAFPEIGKEQTADGVRKHLTRKFRYAIYYRLNTQEGELVILTIRHPSRGPI